MTDETGESKEASQPFFLQDSVWAAIGEWESWSKGVAPYLAPVCGSFCSTMRAACSAAAIPKRVAYTHVWRGALSERFRKEYRERVPNPYVDAEESVRLGKVLDDDERRASADRAADVWIDLDETRAALSTLANESLTADLVADRGLREGHGDLMRMASVLIWGSIEALATDAFELTLNDCPGLAKSLLAHGKGKNLWALPRLTLEVLEEHAFDFSNKLGSLFRGIHRIDTVPVMHVLADAWLSPGRRSEALLVLSRPELRQLAQRRHLIVHRGSRVDDEYVRNTGDRSTPLGDRLEVTAAQLSDSFFLGLDVAKALVDVFWVAARGPADEP